jgi:hypothetical protein
MIADGGTINWSGKCNKINLTMGEYVMNSPMIAIPMGGADTKRESIVASPSSWVFLSGISMIVYKSSSPSKMMCYVILLHLKSVLSFLETLVCGASYSY